MSDDFQQRPPAPATTVPRTVPTTAAPEPDLTDQAGPPADRMPRTRTRAVWSGICVAALLLVVLIVFMLQNTRPVEVTFLGMQGSVPLAMALLIAAVGAAVVTMVIGGARITQLRRISRRRQR